MSGAALSFRRSLALLLVAYALLIGLLQLLWRTPALAIWWMQLLNVFGLWLYLPLPIFLLLALLARPRAVALLLAIPLFCFGWEYGGQFIPQRSTVAGTPLRVMSWNILYDNADIASIERLIRRHDPDVIALQELGTHQADALSPLLARDYPYQALAAGGVGGLGVWSRYPITPLAPPDRGRAGCACQRLMLEVQGQPIRLINVHPLTPRVPVRRWWTAGGLVSLPVPRGFSTRRQEPALDALEDEARTAGAPLIMVGDFNTSDRQPNYWRLRRYLKDAYREAGSGFGLTFPNAGQGVKPAGLPPMLRIDYIFYSADLTAIDAYTDAEPSSDHRAVIADLVITEASAEAVVNREH